MGNVEGFAERLDIIRDLLQKVRPILSVRRCELGPLLTALGHDVFEDPRPPLSESFVSEFEQVHGPLPIEYRLFLTEVGNGGPGPGYGMPELRPPLLQTALTPGRLSPSSTVNKLVVIAALGCGM